MGRFSSTERHVQRYIRKFRNESTEISWKGRPLAKARKPLPQGHFSMFLQPTAFLFFSLRLTLIAIFHLTICKQCLSFNKQDIS